MTETLKEWRDSRLVTYTDGTLVKQGDKIRYHQAPGGMLAHGDWRYGTAEYMPGYCDIELILVSEGRNYGLYSHVVERVA